MGMGADHLYSCSSKGGHRAVWRALTATALCGLGVTLATSLLHAALLQDGEAALTAGDGLAAAGALQPDNTSYVALCVQAKDEHSHIREWVLYHHLIGAGQIYVFDDASEPPMQGVLQELIDAGLVRYHFMLVPLNTSGSGSSNKQDATYAECLRRYGRRHQFMGFIDVDEFVILATGVLSLAGLLGELEGAGGVWLAERKFGPGGHVMRPAGGVLASYTRCCASGGAWGKVFANTDKAVGTHMVDSLVYGDRRVFTVDTLGRPYLSLPLSREAVAAQRATLHHYITRSAEDFLAKSRRGGGTGLHPPRRASFFRAAEARCRLSCEEGLPAAAELWAVFGHLIPPPPLARW